MTDPLAPPNPSRSARLRRLLGRYRPLAGLTALVVIAAVVIAVTDPFGGSAPTNAGVTDNAYPTGTTTVRRGTILSQTEVSATLGYAGTYSISLPSGTPASTIQQDRATVQQDTTAVQDDQAKLAADRRALKHTEALAGPSNASTLRSAEATIQSDTAALAQAKAQLAADQHLSCPASSSSTVTSPSSSAGSPGGSSSPGSGSPGSSNSPAGGSSPGSSSPGSSSPGSSSPGGSSPGSSSPGGSSPGSSSPGANARLDSAQVTAPTVGPATATATGSSSATASATLNPNGSATTYEFEYGTTPALGSRTAPQEAGDGTSPVSVSAALSGLQPGTTYDVALVATNADGTVVGAIDTFQTPRSSCVAQAEVVAEDTTVLANAKDTLATDRLDASATIEQASQTLTTDQQTLANAEQTLANAEQGLSSDEHRQLSAGATVTGVPTVGQIIHRGQAVYSLDGDPVPLLYGSVTPYRALYLGVSPGPDVLALERNLAALGFLPVTPGSQFTAATQAAVEAWQRSLGEPATGTVALGDVAYAPGAIQVDTVTAATGESATGGLGILTATSTIPEVTIDLDASEQSSVHVGDPVSIVLPDNSTTPGVISSVGSVATTPSSGSNGNGPTSPTVTVEVTPTRPAELGHLDQASVNVWITVAKVANAYIVPVDALLALASGGYALEVVGPNGVHALVAVALGTFDDAEGTVQVSGAGVHLGERIVIPKL